MSLICLLCTLVEKTGFLNAIIIITTGMAIPMVIHMDISTTTITMITGILTISIMKMTKTHYLLKILILLRSKTKTRKT